MVSDDSFAKDGRYLGDSTSQAAAVDNSCLNPTFDTNTTDNVIGVANCGGTVSQQGESGQATSPITHQTANPAIELQRATTTTPPPITRPPPTVAACEDCFDILTTIQQSAFEDDLSRRIPGVTTIEQLCELLLNDFNSGEDPVETLNAVDESLNLLEETGVISESVSSSISSCLRLLYG